MSTQYLFEIIARIVPADLRADVERSFLVPQVGPYHQEGPFMNSHLARVIKALVDLAAYQIDERVPESVRSIMIQAIEEVGLDTCRLYVLLHDLDKATCMTLVYTDGRKVAVTWNEWTRMFTGTTGEELTSFCQQEGISQISYYQDQDGVTRTHGRVTADRLRGRDDIPAIVVTAIEDHELAFTFGARGGVNIPLIERMIEGKDWISVGFTLAVNYADQMGSLGADGKPVISDFLLMAESYVAHRKLGVVAERLAKIDRLDPQKVEKALASLRKSNTAFRDFPMTIEVAGMIAEECKLPEVSEARVREALEPSIADGLPTDIVEAIVAEMTTAGKLSSDTGKVLGRWNRSVRLALAKLG